MLAAGAGGRSRSQAEDHGVGVGGSLLRQDGVQQLQGHLLVPQGFGRCQPLAGLLRCEQTRSQCSR